MSLVRNLTEAPGEVKALAPGSRHARTTAVSPGKNSVRAGPFAPTTQPVNLSLEHMGLSAGNPVTLKEWYVKVLGARVVFDNGQSPPMFLLALPGGLMLEIYPGDFSLEQTRNNQLHGWRHAALRVGSIDEAKIELETRGVSFAESVKPAGGGGRVLFFQDPEGNLLHLVERPPGFP